MTSVGPSEENGGHGDCFGKEGGRSPGIADNGNGMGWDVLCEKALISIPAITFRLFISIPVVSDGNFEIARLSKYITE